MVPRHGAVLGGPPPAHTPTAPCVGVVSNRCLRLVPHPLQVVEVTPPTVEQPTAEYFTKV